VLGNANAMATIAVKNLEAAKKFYEVMLGLEQVPAEERVLAYRSGDGMTLMRLRPPMPSIGRPRTAPVRADLRISCHAACRSKVRSRGLVIDLPPEVYGCSAST
jgi:hypothetical protein